MGNQNLKDYAHSVQGGTPRGSFASLIGEKDREILEKDFGPPKIKIDPQPSRKTQPTNTSIPTFPTENSTPSTSFKSTYTYVPPEPFSLKKTLKGIWEFEKELACETFIETPKTTLDFEDIDQETKVFYSTILILIATIYIAVSVAWETTKSLEGVTIAGVELDPLRVIIPLLSILVAPLTLLLLTKLKWFKTAFTNCAIVFFLVGEIPTRLVMCAVRMFAYGAALIVSIATILAVPLGLLFAAYKIFL